MSAIGKSSREKVPTVRADLSKTGMCGSIALSSHLRRPIDSVGDNAFGTELQALFSALDHRAGCADLGMPNGPRYRPNADVP